jgi:leucine dehydrogenase
MSDLCEQLAKHGHEELRMFRDESSGLRGMIGIHDTTLGPAAGGTRRYPFDTEEEAITDVLRLSRAMTYKYAISGINMGGGKAVIWVDDESECSEELYRSYGRVVDSFDGRFVTGGDVGTDEREMRWIHMETDSVIGLPEQVDHPADYHGGGLGVIRAMEACCDLAYDSRDLSDLHVVVQGVGEMGASTVRYLSDAGAQVTVADPNRKAVDAVVDEYDATAVEPDQVYDVACDVFAPCALGSVLNNETIPRLECDIVCGAANNQLADEKKHGGKLHEADILYAPDYLANSGRTIDDTDLLRKGGYNHNRARSMIDDIYDRMLTIGQRSATEDRPTHEIADEMAEERIQAIGSIGSKIHETRTPKW